MIKKTLLMVLFLIQLTSGQTQALKEVSGSIFSEAIGLPFTNYSPLHPGVEIAGTLKRTDTTSSIRYLRLKAGFFHHERLMNAIYLGGEYQYSLKLLKEHVSLDLPVGLGYFHTFYPVELYEQNEDGDFEVVNQLGRAHLYINLGVGFSYINNSKIQPFIRQELLVQTPFANGIPVIPHSIIKIGATLKL